MEEDKNALRKRVLGIRNSTNQGEVQQKSLRIINTILKMHEFNESNNIMCYLDCRNEVKTKNFINICLELGKKVYVPYINNDNKVDAVEIKNTEDDLIIGSYEILEPKNHENVTDLKNIDMIIIPGVVFDLNCNRIGFGKGYYDRLLKEVGKYTVKIGISYEFQLVENIPVEVHDVPMNYVITENRVIKNNEP